MDVGDLRRISDFNSEHKEDGAQTNPLVNCVSGQNSSLTTHQRKYLTDLFCKLREDLEFGEDPVRAVAKLEDGKYRLESEYGDKNYTFDIDPVDTGIIVYESETELYTLDEVDIQSNDPDPDEAYHEVMNNIG